MLVKTSRREWLRNTALGASGYAVSGMMPGGGWLGDPDANAAVFADPLAPRQPHFAPKVKSVIWLHMDGAPSTLDLYDYKPELQRLAGQEFPSPSSRASRPRRRRRRQAVRLGEAQLEAIWPEAAPGSPTSCPISPNMPTSSPSSSRASPSARRTTFRSSSSTPATSAPAAPRSAHGSPMRWAPANPDLPPYVVLYGGRREPRAGSVNWSSGFLPAVYQGTAFRPGEKPILYQAPPDSSATSSSATASISSRS